MKILWFFLSLLPVSFFFVLHEYTYRVDREGTLYAFILSIIFILVVGLLARSVKILPVISANIVACVISLILANFFIPDDFYYFVILGRDGLFSFCFFCFFGWRINYKIVGGKRT